MADPSESQPPPEENYEIGAQLARGGMGTVLAAFDRKLGRQVALKAMSLDAWSDDSQRRRFVREAQVLAQLAHPNIVPIHDLVWEEDMPQFYTMKLVEGRTLQEILDGLRHGGEEFLEAYPLDHLLTIFLKVCDAIGFAHSQGVIHRDLKPDNIMVGEFGEVLVMDWGLAGLMDEGEEGRITNPEEGPTTVKASGGVDLTLDGAVIGTPRYMSPEQAEGRLAEVGPASDIFSLGGILYAILTLRPPVEGDSVKEVFEKLSAGSIIAPSAYSSTRSSSSRSGPSREIIPLSHCVGGKVPAALSAVAMRALSLQQLDRYATTGALAKDIQAFRGGFATSAEKIGTVGHLILLTKRHKVFSAALLIIIVLSVAFVIRLSISAEAQRRSAEIARTTAYSATLAQALSYRHDHDFGPALRILESIEEERRGFDWRLIHRLCQGDQLSSFRLGELNGDEPHCIDLLSDQRMAIISADGRLHLRSLEGAELEPPRLLPVLPMHNGERERQRNYGLTFSPGGKRFAYGNGDLIRVLETSSLKLLHEERLRKPQFAWLTDNRLLYGFNGSVATPPYPKPGAWILEFGSPRDRDGFIPRTAFPQMCAPLTVSPDRKFFVLHWVNTNPTSWERRLNVFPAEAKPGDEPLTAYTMPGLDYPGLLALSNDGRYLAYTGGLFNYLSRSAHVLDLSSKKLLFDQEFQIPLHGLAFDREERKLALVGDDTVVRLYDFTRGEVENPRANVYDDDLPLAMSEPVVESFAHVPPSSLLTRTAQDGRARFFLGHEGRVFDVAFDKHGSLLSSGTDGTIRQWTSQKTKPQLPGLRLGHMECTYDREYPTASRDGRQIFYFGGASGYLCDVPLSQARGRIEITVSPPRHAPLALLRDGRAITLSRDESLVTIWKVEEGSFHLDHQFGDPTGKLPGVGRPRAAALSRDERRLVGALPGQLFSVDLSTSELRSSRNFVQRTGAQGVASHALSPDGRWIAASGLGPRVSIHRFEDPNTIVAHLAGEARDFDTAVTFSHDGKLLYTGNEDGRIRVWETRTWTEIPELGFTAHRGAVTALALSHDRTLIATSGDTTLKLFPVKPEPGSSFRRERLSFRLRNPANWIQFARGEDGGDRALMHCTPGGTLEVWEAQSLPFTAKTLPNPRNMPRHRHAHGLVALPNGHVLTTGGEGTTTNGQHVALSDCFLYDPVSERWTMTGSLRTPRSRRLSPLLLDDGKVLLTGGTGRQELGLASCELYDPVKGTWEETGSMQETRVAHRVFKLKNGVLAIGGSSADGQPLSSCEFYDPTTGTWHPRASLQQLRGAVTADVLPDGRILALGSNTGSRRRSSLCEIYDPESDQWTVRTPPPAKHGVVWMITLPQQSQILALCADDQSRDGDKLPCYLYDIARGSWKETGPLAVATFRTHGIVARLPDGRVIALGAKREAKLGVITNVEIFDPTTETWSRAPNLNIPRLTDTFAMLEDGRIFLCGGVSERGLSDSIEIYEVPRK